MRLKRIDIFGFKSFADRVSIDFDDGITGIVGPNGCGKSNLIEAVRWALGEQNSRLIRAVKMEEVIFNGTTERAPLAFSEIDLTFEAKGETPSPLGFHEITFKRRVKRDGFCEYFINQTPCLLRDIIETLRNIGITSRSYSLFSIDAIKRILDDDSQVRRDMFAEVAGIAKYQAQKSVTLSRLKDTQADIQRLGDKIEEVNTNLAMLKKDLRKANHYKNLKKQYEEKILLFSRRKRDQIRKAEEAISEEIEKSAAERQKLEEEAKKVSSEADRLWTEEAEFMEKLSSLKEKLEKDAAVHSQMNADLAQKKQELKYLREKIEGQERELTESQNAIPSLNETLAGLKSKFEECLTEEKEKIEKKNQLLSALVNEKAQIMKLKEELARRINEKENAFAEDNLLQREISVLAEKKSVKSEYLRKLSESYENRKIEKETAQEKLRSCREAISRLDGEEKNLQIFIAGLQEKNSKLASERESLTSLVSSFQSELASCESELAILSEQQEDLEGYDEATKYFLKKYGLETLNEIIKVDKGYELPVEIALASALGAVILDGASLESRIAELEKENKGKGWFLLKDVEIAYPLKDLPQGLDPLISHVRSDDDYASDFLRTLLEGWIVVNKRTDITEMSKKYPYLDIVSLDGNSVRKRILYSTAGQKARILGRKERIEDLLKLKDILKEKIGQTEESREKNRISLEDVNKTLGDKADILKMTVDRKSTLLTEEKNSKYRLEVFEKTDAEEALEEKLLKEELNEAEENLREKNKRQAKLIVELENLGSVIESVKNTLADAERKIEPSLARISDIETETARISERKSSLEEKIGDKTRDINIAEKRRQELIESLSRGKEKAKEEELKINSHEEKNQEAENRINELKKEAESLQNGIEAIRKNLRTAEEKSRGLETKKTELMDAAGSYSVKMADLRGEMNSIAGELETAFGIGAEKLDEVNPEGEEVSKEDIFRIKSRLMTMGSVNENAEEEYAEILERFNFLNTQRDDLENTKKGLRETITSIDKVAREKFLETFEAVRENFKNIFSVLFKSNNETGSDFQADLQLEQEKDPLESDIKVLAVPPGKKLSTTRWLSTGEQSFTALSLLYALHQIRFSPLVVLDEVDAPLDDSNVEIFIRFLKTIALESQVVLVTHNRRTMEFCQGLYGITMEEKGVSSVVSVNLEKIDEFLGEDN